LKFDETSIRDCDLLKMTSCNVSPTVVDQLERSIQYFLDYGGSMCLLYGGETTVVVRGTGKGGRNQETVLAFADNLLSNAIGMAYSNLRVYCIW